MQLEEVGKPTKRTSEWDNKRTKPVRTSIKTDQLEASRKRPRGEEDDLNSQDDSKRMIHRMTQFPDHTLWVPAQRWSAVERTIERSFVWSTEWPFGQFKWRTASSKRMIEFFPPSTFSSSIEQPEKNWPQRMIEHDTDPLMALIESFRRTTIERTMSTARGVLLTTAAVREEEKK